MKVDRDWQRREARRLRDLGASYRTIAFEIGTTRETARCYVDPAYARQVSRENFKRKESYRGTCERCGAKTTGCYGPGRAPKRCGECARLEATENRRWTKEAVIEAIQRWAREFGSPPLATDWLRSIASGRPEWAPAGASVYRSKSSPRSPFASWADAIEAAGYPRPLVGKFERTEETRRRMSKSLTYWTPELIVGAIRAWVAIHGRVPGWDEWRSVRGKPKAEGVPSVETVKHAFGSWRAGIEAAGFEPRHPGEKIFRGQQAIEQERTRP